MSIEVGPISNHELYSYDEAWLYCLTLSHNGHKDWRMPDIMDSWTYPSVELHGWFEDDWQYNQGPYTVTPVRDIND